MEYAVIAFPANTSSLFVLWTNTVVGTGWRDSVITQSVLVSGFSVYSVN